MDEGEQEEIDADNEKEKNFFLKLLHTTTVEVNYDELSPVRKWITTFLRQAYCSGCCGLFTAPFVTAMADLYRKERETDELRYYRYLGSLEQMLIRYYEFQMMGLLLGGICAYILGRRNSVILSNVLLLAAVLVIGSQEEYSTKDKYALIEVNFGISLLLGVHEFQRLIFGIYIAEVTNSTFRAFFMAFFYFSYCCATYSYIPFVADVLYKPWKVYNTILASGLLVVSCLMVPETPFWLARTGQTEEAVQRFKWLRAGTSDEDELIAMLDKAEQVAEQRASVKTMLYNIFSKDFGLCLLITTTMLFALRNLFVLMCSVLSFEEFYRLHFFRDGHYRVYYITVRHTRHFGNFMRAYLPIFGISIFMVSNFFISRKVLFLGSIIIQLPLFYTYYQKYDFAGKYYWDEHPDQEHQWRLLTKAGYLCYLYAYVGAIPVSMILPVEIFPAVVREIGVFVSYFMEGYLVFWNTNIIWSFDMEVVKLADQQAKNRDWKIPEVQKLAIYIEYVLFPIGLVLTILLMPETKGMTLEEAEEAVKPMEILSLANLEEESVIEEQTE